MHIKDGLKSKVHGHELSHGSEETGHACAEGDCDCSADCDCSDLEVSGAVSVGQKAKQAGKPVQEKAFVPPEERGVSLGREAELEIEHTMGKRYKRFLKVDERIAIETEVCHQFARVKFVLSNPSRTTHVDIDAYLDCEENGFNSPIDAYHAVLDILDLTLLDYFESERISHYLSIWQSYDCDGKTAHIRLEHANLALVDEASAFLRAHGFDEDGGQLD